MLTFQINGFLLLIISTVIITPIFSSINHTTINWKLLTEQYNSALSVWNQNFTKYYTTTLDSILQSVLDDNITQQSMKYKTAFTNFNVNFQYRAAESHKDKSDSINLNVLFTGGSVDEGHGCCQFTQHPSDESVIVDCDLMCSWNHRFVYYLQQILNENSMKKINIVPRFCARSGASTLVGADILLSREFDSTRCRDLYFETTLRGNGYQSSSKDSSLWMPDLVIWDHSPNDDNPLFFREYTQAEAYEKYITSALNLPSRPQIICFDSGLQSSSTFMKRMSINKRYGVPTIAYPYVIARLPQTTVLKRPSNSHPSIWYAVRLPNKHPAWPTHIIWSQLVTNAMLDLFDSSNILDMWNVTYKSMHIPSNYDFNLHNKDDGGKNANDICRKGYSTYYDFGGGKISATLVRGRTGDTIYPSNVIGNWSFFSDVPKDRERTGWIYYNKNISQHPYSIKTTEECDKNSLDNYITFTCHEVPSGNVKLGYLKSYGGGWGKARVSVSAAFRNSSTIAYNIHYEDSRWNDKSSVPNIVTISPQVNVGENADIETMNITVSLCRGEKFKILSLACC
jgi:hypothetical protein